MTSLHPQQQELVVVLKSAAAGRSEENIARQIITLGRVATRVETLVRHLKASDYDGGTIALQSRSSDNSSEMAIVPLPGTRNYFNWLSILLQHRTSMGTFLQSWMQDSSRKVGGSAVRRIRTLAAHLCAPPLVVDAW